METTTNYSLFKNIRGNRDVYPGHVQKLRAAITRKNLLPYIPLLLNEKMEVIDGQHRLEAAKLEKLEISYVIIPGLKLEDVMALNTTSRGWSAADFVDGWIKAGKSDYEVLKDVAHAAALSLGATAGLLMYGPTSVTNTGGGHASEAVRKGTFEVRYLEFAHTVINQLNDLVLYCDFDDKKDRNFISTISRLNMVDAFDFGYLVTKLKMSGMRIAPRVSVRYYILQLDDLYNWKNRQRIDLYASSQR